MTPLGSRRLLHAVPRAGLRHRRVPAVLAASTTLGRRSVAPPSWPCQGWDSRRSSPTAPWTGCPRPSTVVLLPGFGLPAGRDAPRSPRELAQLLLARLDDLGYGRAILLGHSASCQIVVQAAAQAPGRVAALVLVGPTTDPRARDWPSLAARWLRTAVWERPGQLPLLLRDYWRTGLGAMVPRHQRRTERPHRSRADLRRSARTRRTRPTRPHLTPPMGRQPRRRSTARTSRNIERRGAHAALHPPRCAGRLHRRLPRRHSGDALPVIPLPARRRLQACRAVTSAIAELRLPISRLGYLTHWVPSPCSPTPPRGRQRCPAGTDPTRRHP